MAKYIRKSIYGYFDSPDQTVPVYDPGLDVPCPVCMWPVGGHTPDHPIMTISVMVESDDRFPRDARSYFYRIHKSCYEAISEEQRSMLDSVIVDAVAQATRSNN
jgi:hypothetical protein